MKATVIITAIITMLILFGVTTNMMSDVTNTTIWTGMNNSGWEDGFMKLAPPFAVLAFGIAVVFFVFKGNKPDNPFGGE
jgi:amino acid transporter